MTLTRVRTALLGAAVAAFAVLAVAAPASAHDSLTGSDPATGASVEVAPGSVTLNFSADLMKDGAEAHVYEGTDPVESGKAGATDFTNGAATVDGTSLVIPLRNDVPAGTYSVNWRVVSSDGHPISTSDGKIISFTVTKGSTPQVITPATPTMAPTDATTSTAPTATDTTHAATQGDQKPADSQDNSSAATIVIIIGGIVILALIIVIVTVMRKRKA